MFMVLDSWPFAGRSVFLLKFNLISSSDGKSYNTLVICNRLIDNSKCNILVDTGASFPVWTKSVNLLQTRYPQAVETQYKAWLGGFGGDGNEVPVWRIPRFILSDGNDSVSYEDLHVAIHPMPSNFDMVMSFPMLRHAMLTYITPGNGCIPELQINCSRSVVLSHPRFSFMNGKQYMSGVFVYMQDDYDISKLVHDPCTLMAIMEKHPNYTQWFNDNFPNGASSADEVRQRLVEESMVSS